MRNGRLHTDPALKARAGSEVERGLRLYKTARFVIERCDGAHSVQDLARALADTWGVAEAQAAKCPVTVVFLNRSPVLPIPTRQTKGGTF
jgi:hypothetical protein